MDPWQIRLLNAYRNGDTRPYRKTVKDATLVEVIKAAAEMSGHALPERCLAMSSWDRTASPERSAGEREG
jgi:CO/xanthine dehydrogenase Mo-binding subunit